MTQSELAFNTLQRLIEEGRLKPGSMISERGLMAITGLGRTPVREAIQRLERNYMVRVHPSKGIEIPANSVEDQLSRLEVRRAMEVLAVGLACKRATAKDLELIEAMATALKADFSFSDYAETVRQTHKLIIDSAHNPYLEALMKPLQALSRRFWMTHVRDENAEVLRGKTLHREILLAIAERNVRRAEAASLALNDYLVEFALRTVNENVRTGGGWF
ncbi:GntR family transcriptional regulator [Rhodoligotrophos defluvii]|uniref:GntR family transcriptional regulator n=1 Tax=Rhodoligotrophos defluvii TaxID=2561934 RepID=UPI0010C99FFD|nr:GntR family transcriptional regulator [Rhodoligotrophos defluvii]